MSGQQKGCGFPVAKMLGVFCLSTGAWLGHALSQWRGHDLSLWHRLSHLLVKGDVLVGDAGFCAYALMAELKARGVDTVFRLHQKRSKDMRRGKRLGPDDRIQTWSKPAQRPAGSPWKKRAWNKLPAQLEVRIVRVRIEKKGFCTHGLWIATTLSDAGLYPAEKLAELYYRRWSIELFYRDGTKKGQVFCHNILSQQGARYGSGGRGFLGRARPSANTPTGLCPRHPWQRGGAAFQAPHSGGGLPTPGGNARC